MNKFASRKLAVTVGTVASLVAAHQYVEAAAVAIGYIVVQAGVDAAEVRKVAVDVEKVAKVAGEVAAEVATNSNAAA